VAVVVHLAVELEQQGRLILVVVAEAAETVQAQAAQAVPALSSSATLTRDFKFTKLAFIDDLYKCGYNKEHL
jgi:hypothetical protein